MPDPSLLKDILDVQVTVAEAKAAGASFALMMLASEFELPAQWALDGFDRGRIYVGDLLAVDDELAAHGFPEAGAARRMARSALRQTPTPDRIEIGRRDPADASWSAALTAIRDAADVGNGASGSDFYAFAIEDRDDASVAAASAWAEGKFVRYFAQNESADVLASSPGNLLRALQDLKRRRTVYLWHDASAASGLGPAKIRTSAAGPWDVSSVLGGYLNPEVDGTETPILLEGAPAIELGTEAGPFNFAGIHQISTLTVTPDAGNTVGFHFDALAPLTAVSVNLAADNIALKAAFDGAPAYTAIGALAIVGSDLVFTASDYAAHAFTDDSSGGTADVAQVLTQAAVSHAAWHLDLEVPNGAAPVVVTFGPTVFADDAAATAAEVGAAVRAAVGASKILAGDAGALGLGAAGRFAMATPKAGSGQTFEVVNTSTAALLTELGIASGVNSGSGDMADSSAMTPAEVAAWIQGAPVPGATAIAVGVGKWTNYVEIEGDSLGEFATLRVRGAAVNDVLGFPRELVRGVGTDEDYAEVAWAAGRVGGAKLDLPRPQGLVTLDDFRPFDDGRMKADALKPGQRSNVRAQGGNTLELRTAKRKPGEFHFGKAPSGHFVDTLIAADWLTLRILESIKDGLDAVAELGQQIDFSNDGARAFFLERIGDVFDRAVASGILAGADMTPPDPAIGKRTGLVVPTLEELPEDGPTLDRFWSGIEFVQQGGRALHGAIVRGTVLP